MDPYSMGEREETTQLITCREEPRLAQGLDTARGSGGFKREKKIAKGNYFRLDPGRIKLNSRFMTS
jgi:hypothetical protein